MGNILTIFKREFRNYFNSPIAYIFMMLFQFFGIRVFVKVLAVPRHQARVPQSSRGAHGHQATAPAARQPARRGPDGGRDRGAVRW